MNNTDTTVSVIIPTHNRTDALILLIEDIKLQATNANPIEILVVNSDKGINSHDECLSRANSVCTVKYIESDNFLAKKRNEGATLAKNEILIFLDDDMRLEPGYITQMLNKLKEHPNSAICSDISYFQDWVKHQNYYKYKLRQHEQSPDANGRLQRNRFVAMSFAVHKSIYWKVGGFDEDFVMYGGEDQAFAYQCEHAGVDIVFQPNATAIHGEVSSDAVSYALKLYETGYQAMPILFRKYPQSLHALSNSLAHRAANRKSLSGKLLCSARLNAKLGFSLAKALKSADKLTAIDLSIGYKALTLLMVSSGYIDATRHNPARPTGVWG